MKKHHLPLLAAALAFAGLNLNGCADSEDTGDADATDGADLTDADGADRVDQEGAPFDADARDNGTEGDGPVTCISDYDCANGLFCDGVEKCIDGTCRPPEKTACADAHECTVESCDEEAKECNYELNHEICDDDLICNGQERCSALHGCVSGTVPDCTDDDICTIDTCIEERDGCVHDSRDLDGDDHIDKNCGGDDCNDRDAEINPDMTEICDDLKDNNCDMAVDMSDVACRPANDTCANPTVLMEGVVTRGSTFGTAHDYTASDCYIYSERDVTFRIDLAAEKDLMVTVTSVSASGMSVAIQSVCGSSVTELICQETSTTITLQRNRLPAGAYYVIVWTDREGDFDISYTTQEPTPRPVYDTCDGAVDVSAGGTYSGTTVDCLNDYAPTCMSVAGIDTFYTFTLSEARKITLTANAPSGYPSVGVSLMSTCGDPGSELQCATAYNTATVTRNFLPAGTYYVAVEVSQETAYTLTMTFAAAIYPPPNDRCDGAIDISAGGFFVGNLMESYRDYTTSCSLSTYTDIAYRFTTLDLQDVTLQLDPVGAAADMALAVVTDCSDMRTEVRCRKGNPAGFTLRSLPAGTYFVIVSGTLHGSGTTLGRYLLQASFGPPTPVPANDSCLGAVDISAGGTVIGTTVGTFDDYDTDCGPSNFYDAVYRFTLASDSDVILDVDPAAPTEVALEIERTCGDSFSMLDCASSTSGELRAHSVPAGTYFLIVDTGVETDFNMEVTYGPPTSICDGSTEIVVDLTSGTFTWSESGTTVGQTNKFESSSCGYYATSPDVPYILRVPSRANVVIEDTAASFDTVIHMRSLCDSISSEIYCNDDGGSCSLCSRISAILEAGTYYVFQDGYGSSHSGTYTLTVTATSSP